MHPTERKSKSNRDQIHKNPPQGTSIHFARASAVLPFVAFLESIGSPTERLLQQAHISAALLDEPDSLIPLIPAYRFIEQAAQLEHLENLGIVVGQQTSAFDLGAYGAALAGTSTIYEYLQIGIKLIGSHSSGTRFWIASEGDAIRINQYLQKPAGLGRCIADLYTLVVTINMMRQFIGPNWNPDEIRLLAGNEKLLGENNPFEASKLVLRQHHSSFTIPRALLMLPVPKNDATFQVEDAPSVLVPPMPQDFRTSMEHVVRSLVSDGEASIEVASEVVGMSPRTLQRRLSEVGCVFSHLVASSRLQLAKYWLTQTDIPVVEIAVTLGYTDTSNFARAFKRMAGVPPSVYRRTPEMA